MQKKFCKILLLITASGLASCQPALINVGDLPEFPKQVCKEPIVPGLLSPTITLRIKDGKLLEADPGAVRLLTEYAKARKQ
jgi:hypothetical protein